MQVTIEICLHRLMPLFDGDPTSLLTCNQCFLCFTRSTLFPTLLQYLWINYYSQRGSFLCSSGPHLYNTQIHTQNKQSWNFMLQVSHSSPLVPWRASAWNIFQSYWAAPPQTTRMSSFWNLMWTCSVEGLLVPSLRQYRKCFFVSFRLIQMINWQRGGFCASWLEFIID